MSAIVNAIGGTLSDASAGWDPIGNWIINNDMKNANKILKPIENLSNQIDPLAPFVRSLEQQVGSSIRNDPVLQWAAESTHDLGTSIDAGLQDIGINPDSLKMAIAGFFAPYAVPLLQAAMVKARGGSWEDAVLGAAVSYAAQYVGQAAGDWMGSYVSGAPTTASQVGQQYGISAASQQAAQIAAQNASAMGITDLASGAMASALTRAGVSSTVGQLIQSGDVDLNKVLDTMKSSGIVAGTSLLTSQIPGWNNLSPEAKSAINKTVAGTLQGKDPTAIGLSVALDTAVSGVKNYFGDAVTGIRNTYNSALDLFNKNADAYTSQEATAQATYDRLSGIKSEYDSKVASYNDLVQRYNTSGDANILSQINALKPQIESLQNQWAPLYDTYQQQLGSYNASRDQLNTAMQQIIDSRREFYDTAAQAINPTADMAAYLAINKDVQDEIERTGKSAAQIYFERQMADPTLNQNTTWASGINAWDNSKLDEIAALYKGATGFDLNVATGGMDPLTWQVYQQKVNQSQDWYNTEVDKAIKSGDYARYLQLATDYKRLSPTFQTATAGQLATAPTTPTTPTTQPVMPVGWENIIGTIGREFHPVARESIGNPLSGFNPVLSGGATPQTGLNAVSSTGNTSTLFTPPPSAILPTTNSAYNTGNLQPMIIGGLNQVAQQGQVVTPVAQVTTAPVGGLNQTATTPLSIAPVTTVGNGLTLW